jgi:hypothetical protein
MSELIQSRRATLAPDGNNFSLSRSYFLAHSGIIFDFCRICTVADFSHLADPARGDAI